jgi:hypothetical protein
MIKSVLRAITVSSLIRIQTNSFVFATMILSLINKNNNVAHVKMDFSKMLLLEFALLAILGALLARLLQQIV